MFFIPLRHLLLFTEHAVHLIEGGIIGVKVLAVHLVLRDAQGIGEALVMHKLPLAQKLDRLAHVGIICQAQDIVVGRACLLLCYYHVFATKLSLAKVRKILMFQGISVLLELTIFQKFQ